MNNTLVNGTSQLPWQLLWLLYWKPVYQFWHAVLLNKLKLFSFSALLIWDLGWQGVPLRCLLGFPWLIFSSHTNLLVWWQQKELYYVPSGFKSDLTLTSEIFKYRNNTRSEKILGWQNMSWDKKAMSWILM